MGESYLLWQPTWLRSSKAFGNLRGHSVSTIVVQDSNGSMGKDCHRADQTGHVRGNPSDDTLPDLWCVADIFLPQEKGALVVRLLGVAPPHSRRGSGPPCSTHVGDVP